MAKQGAGKELTATIKLQAPGGQATPAPPIGPALGQHGVNIGQFIQQFNADTAALNGMPVGVVISVYSDRIGKPIAPPFVTIVDDGTNPHERGSLNIDDEGCATERTVLVENGILRSYMHDRISAAHYRLAPSGNGRRQSFRWPPVPRMRNTTMLNGPHKPEEIIASVSKGIYAEQFTNGQVRIGSGDFSFYLKNGYLIEDGKLTRPIKDANLIGFGPKVLEDVQMVADDMRLNVGAGTCGKDGQQVPVGMGLPTCKCGSISVGGVG